MDCRGNRAPEGGYSRSNPTMRLSRHRTDKLLDLLKFLNSLSATILMSKSRTRPANFSNPTPVRKLKSSSPRVQPKRATSANGRKLSRTVTD